MSWLKDNLIYVLAILVLVLGVALALTHYRGKAKIADLNTKFQTATDNYNDLKAVNDDHILKLKASTDANNKLIERQALEKAAASAAAEKVVAAQAETTRAYNENAQLRRALKARSPEAKQYLEQGMPRELACTIWPTSCAR